jgi:hypothetical protein
MWAHNIAQPSTTTRRSKEKLRKRSPQSFRMKESGMYLLTEVTPFKAFYAAEVEQQEYFRRNPDQPYCRVVIEPKVAKFRKQFLAKISLKFANFFRYYVAVVAILSIAIITEMLKSIIFEEHNLCMI